MQAPGKLLSGIIVGAGAMYLLDSERGARRRSLLRDQDKQVGPKERQIWPPATSFLVGSLGGLVVLQSGRTRGLRGKVLRLVGLGLVSRAAANIPARRLIAFGSGGRAIVVEKTLNVGAPVDQVWELWSNFENFPRFMAHLREVQKIDEGRSRWVAVGPAGVPDEWEAIVTDWVPGQFIGWRSVDGSPVGTSGQVRLRPVSARETQIDVQLAYTRPPGAAGHPLASLLGVDPRRAMDEDLLRLKSLLEDQQTPTPDKTVHLQEVAGSAKPARRTKKTSSSRKK
jgi:uncharacterized membrane protein